jgi:pathogenesis-related protein 1
MFSRRFGLTVIAGALPFFTQVSWALADGVSAAEREAILGLHNAYRAQHCVAAVTWSAELAASAQQWADKCWIAHDSRRGHIGENLAWGGDRSASSAVDAWYREVDDYTYGKPGFASSTAHFTQMVWKGTKQIGCGVAKCYLGTVRLWVCRYAPTGNWAGQYPQNVPRRCK